MPVPRIAGLASKRLSAGRYLAASYRHVGTHPVKGGPHLRGGVNQIANFSSQTKTSTQGSTSSNSTTAVVAFSLLSAGLAYFLLPSQVEAEAQSNPNTTIPVLPTTQKGSTMTVGDLEREASVSTISHRSVDKTYNTITPDQATEFLSKFETETTVPLGRNSGTIRYYNNQIACNDPIEDDHSEAILPKPSASGGLGEDGLWFFWGIYDGHSGWATSAKLRQSLINAVYQKLLTAYKTASSSSPSPQDPLTTLTSTPTPTDIANAIKAGFTALDNEIVHSNTTHVLKLNSKALATQLLAPALSGSCALLAFYDVNTQLLRVACTGDSRAVLGRRVNATTWSATPLSSDQTGANPSEAARIRAEHPGEPDIVRNGRVLGYEPARVFGDASLKWARGLSLTMREKFYGKYPSEKVVSPPYATAEPVVTTTRIHPERGDFVVMGCDGLWEMLSNEEVVGLVASWLEKNPLGGQQGQRGAAAQIISAEEKKSWVAGLFGRGGDEVVMPTVVAGPDADKFFGSKPVRPTQWQIEPAVAGGDGLRRRSFVVQDANVATHLARNGLGGGNHDLLSSLLVLGGKNARRFRDDLTITVIFFGSD